MRMKILSGLLIVYLCLLSRKIDCGLVADIFDAFNPLNILDMLDKALTTPTPSPTITVKTKLITVEETVFHVAPILQALFEPYDALAQVNYVMSPLSAVSLLGQVLIGTHGPFHRYVEYLLEFNLKTKRQVQIYELTKDDLYDEKLYHSAFHWKFKRLLNTIKSSTSSVVTLENAFVYNKNAELVKHFKEYIEEYYKTKIFPVNPDEIDKSVLEWIEMNEKRRNPMWPTQETNRAVFGTKLKFASTWDTPFKDNLTEGPFQINSFEEIKIKYLQATIKNTTYLQTNLFTFAVIPLKNREFQLYVILPADKKTPIREFSESLRDFEFFKTMESHEPVNMELEMPKIFPYVADLDLMPPIHDNFRGGYSRVKNIALNGAAKNLLLTNSIQHLEISIENEGQQLKSVFGKTTTVELGTNQVVDEQPVWVRPEEHSEVGQRGFVQEQPIGSAQQPRQSSESELQRSQFRQQPSKIIVQQTPATANQTIQFKVNCPFLFLIMHESTKMAVLWGSILDPSKL